MSDEQAKQILISKMADYLAQTLERFPERGAFQPYYVVIAYPGTNYEGFLQYESDLTDESGYGRRIKTAMCPKNSDRAVSHYLFKGTQAACRAWLMDKKTEELLRQDYEQLKKKLDSIN